MNISFTCKCGQPYSLGPEWAGRAATCTRCGQVLVVPGVQPGPLSLQPGAGGPGYAPPGYGASVSHPPHYGPPTYSSGVSPQSKISPAVKWTLVGGAGIAAVLGIVVAINAVSMVNRPNPGNTNFPAVSVAPVGREIEPNDPVAAVPLEWKPVQGKGFSALMPGKVHNAFNSQIWGLIAEDDTTGLYCKVEARTHPSRLPEGEKEQIEWMRSEVWAVNGKYERDKAITICGYPGREAAFQSVKNGISCQGIGQYFDTPTCSYALVFVANRQQFKEDEVRRFLESFKIEK